MTPRAARALLVWLLVACAGSACSRLPNSAAPKLRTDVTYAMLESFDVIAYRTLTREDFKGTAAPREFAAIADHLGAATCSHLLTTAGTKAVIVERYGARGERHFESRAHELGFRAVMDRSCSWWNDTLAALRPEYVLQHEQIHFAITELQARRLNATALEVMQQRFTAATQDEAFAHVQRAVQEQLEEGSQAVLERSRDFDEDTSVGYRPDRQSEWFERISLELERTRKFARR